ncbi:MAG: hypothetical protein DCC49_04565 [Acidobacteria bacterium]|nr:MAG: hypothetical protein DCC49_04565 [Acidobacteriota bacterium]
MTSRSPKTLIQFAIRELPLLRGKHRLVHLAAPRLGALPEPAYAKLPGGAKMLLSDGERPDFWYLGSIEPDVTPVFRRQLKEISPSSCFVDVGANRGYYSLIAAKTHRVFAFEPNPGPLADLRESLELNGFDSVTLVQAAVSDSSGHGQLHLHESVTELSSLVQVHDDLDSRIDVDQVTLDEHFRGYPGVTVGLIKMDIQGAELLALRGAVETIQRDRPVLIIEEWPFGHAGFGYDTADLKAFLCEQQYKLYRIDKGRFRWGVVRPAHPTKADVAVARDADTNLLCLPSGRL